MKVHKEGTGLLLTLFTILFIVNITLYHTVGKGMLFYSVAFVSTVSVSYTHLTLPTIA